jgi:hypothetical protein
MLPCRSDAPSATSKKEAQTIVLGRFVSDHFSHPAYSYLVFLEVHQARKPRLLRHVVIAATEPTRSSLQAIQPPTLSIAPRKMCFRPRDDADGKRSRQIDALIHRDEKVIQRQVKLLLLGEPDCPRPDRWLTICFTKVLVRVVNPQS